MHQIIAQKATKLTKSDKALLRFVSFCATLYCLCDLL
jgi:hypothetical protein